MPPAPGTILGVIKDSVTLDPIQGVVVTTSGGAQSEPSNSLGQYMFTDAAGTYTMWANKTGYNRYTSPITIIAFTNKTKNFSMEPV